MADRLEFDWNNKQTRIVELTAEEVAVRDAQIAAAEQELAARNQELDANVRVRQALGQELGRRLVSAPGKTFDQLTDREILHMLVRERFGALQNVGIFDANGVVQTLGEWRV